MTRENMRRRRLDHVIDYVYSRSEAETQAEHELRTITLRLLAHLKRDEFDGTNALDMATAYSGLGRSFNEWRQNTRDRIAARTWEVGRLNVNPQISQRKQSLLPLKIRVG
jgi:hypothetical protein